jgi:signal transduction histidine kinase
LVWDTSLAKQLNPVSFPIPYSLFPMKTLRGRLTRTHALVALVAIIIVAALTTVLVRRGVEQLTIGRAGDNAEVLADRLTDFYEDRQSWDGVQVFLRRRLFRAVGEQSRQDRRMQLVDDRGVVLFDSSRPVLGPGAVQPINGAKSPVEIDGRTVGTVIVGVRVNEWNAAERTFLMQLYISVIGGSLLAGVIALVVGSLITRQLTRPLRSLTDAARRLAAGQRHQSLAIPQEMELAALAHSFNTMAAELDRQEHLRRQLVADIAHELRTPLSVLRLQVESLEDGVEQPTPHMLSSLGQEVHLLTRLVDDLRLLSLADAGQLSLTLEAVDPLAVLRRVAAAAEPRARQQQIELRVEHIGALPNVCADSQRLAQVLGNLVENALRYTPAGGVVTLVAREMRDRRLEIRDSALTQSPISNLQSPISNLQSPISSPQLHIAFEIRDTGPGIAPTDLPHIFERFYRTDRARSRESGGSGLGLAIVQRLVEAQGGKVDVSSELGKGTTFCVLLPAA